MKKVLIGAAVAVVAGTAALAQTAPPPGVAQGTMTAPVAQAAPQTRVMVMSNRTMTRDEVVAHVRKLFERFDANKDGYLTREEIDATRDRMMGMPGDMQKRLAERGVMMGDSGAMFDRLDANHDGNISRQEFMAGHSQMHQQRVMIMREGGANAAPGAPGEPEMKMRMHGMGMHGGFGAHLFEMADTNKDGRVSLAEAQATALAHFDRIDVNHDGKITPDEHNQARQLKRERRPS